MLKTVFIPSKLLVFSYSTKDFSILMLFNSRVGFRCVKKGILNHFLNVSFLFNPVKPQVSLSTKTTNKKVYLVYSVFKNEKNGCF